MGWTLEDIRKLSVKDIIRLSYFLEEMRKTIKKPGVKRGFNAI